MTLTKDISQHAPASTVAAAMRAATNLFGRGESDALGGVWDTDAGANIALAVDATTPSLLSPKSVKVTKTRLDNAGARAKATGLVIPAGIFGVGSIYFKGGVVGGSYAIYIMWILDDASVISGSAGAVPVVATGQFQLATALPSAVPVGRTGASLCVYVEPRNGVNEVFWMANAMLETAQSVVAPYVPTSGGASATRPAMESAAEVANLMSRFKSNVLDPAR